MQLLAALAVASGRRGLDWLENLFLKDQLDVEPELRVLSRYCAIEPEPSTEVGETYEIEFLLAHGLEFGALPGPDQAVV